MRTVRLALAVIAVSVLGAASSADPTAASITDRGHTLAYIVEQIVRPGETEGQRTVVLLVDPSPALVKARFAEVLEAVLGASKNPDLAVGLAVVGDRTPLRAPPSPRREAAIEALRDVLREPKDEIRNVYAPIRALAKAPKDADTRREIVLVTLENGDGEDDLERTRETLESTGTVLHVIGRTAMISDSYWVRVRWHWKRSGKEAPGGLDLRGQDAAYDDLPWGWILQRYSAANELTPSGFGFYGLSRLVARSGGRYYLYYPTIWRSYERCRFGACRICAGEHADCGRRYEAHRLRELAPDLSSRVDQRKRLSRDPLSLALLDVWREASDARLTYSRPPLRRGPGLLRLEETRYVGWGGLYMKPRFPTLARRSRKLEETCHRLSRVLEKALAAVDPEKTSKRIVALAETTHAQLLLARLNFRLLQAFCDRAEGWRKRPSAGLLAPERPFFAPGQDHGRSLGVENVCFCHGTKAVEELHVPCLAEAGEIREEAFAAIDRLRERYDGTPFGRLARQMGVALFDLVDPAKAGEGVSADGRAPRGAAGGGAGGGTTTGGK